MPGVPNLGLAIEIQASPTRSGAASRAERFPSILVGGLAGAAILLLFLAAISSENFVDPDVYHQLALVREALVLGHLPLEDRFAYTPTVVPSVQHEWGHGAVLMLVTRGAGGSGILILKYALALGIAALTWVAARRAGASLAVRCALLPIGALLVATGFSTLRAQVPTLFCTAYLVHALVSDRRGDRRWILSWLVVYVLWVNLHAGFVVGFLLFGLHAGETLARRRPARHLLLGLAAMIVLVLANPYGWRYLPAVAHGLTLDRSLVTEWDPIWRETPVIQVLFAFSLLVVAYAAGRRGWRSLDGLILVAASAVAAIQHQRHLSIYGVVWCALAPAWVAVTPLGLALEAALRRRRIVTAALASILFLSSAVVLVREEPWRLRVPANPEDHASLLYPAGAVDYLSETGFEGNSMTPFTVGAYVSWRLHPRVKVSFDSRYEVAYPPGAARENRDFYAAREGWRAILERYPTDVVLAPVRSRVASELDGLPDWSSCYRDDAFRLFTRPGLSLPSVDRRGTRIAAAFP